MSQKVIKTGNSLAVTIPADFVKMVGIKAQDEVRVSPKPDKGTITYIFSGVKQLPLSEIFLKKEKKKR